jgi:hypothetical protein
MRHSYTSIDSLIRRLPSVGSLDLQPSRPSSAQPSRPPSATAPPPSFNSPLIAADELKDRIQVEWQALTGGPPLTDTVAQEAADTLLRTAGVVPGNALAKYVCDLCAGGVRVVGHHPPVGDGRGGHEGPPPEHHALPPPPRYTPAPALRGRSEDTYFAKPVLAHMADNRVVIETLAEADDAAVSALPNLSIQGPTLADKCKRAAEFKMGVDACFVLAACFGVYNVATVYRYLALLPDRMCVACVKPSTKISCVAGGFFCQNCVTRLGGQPPFVDAFLMWLRKGAPVRHASTQSPGPERV